MSKEQPKVKTEISHIKDFINSVCEGDLSIANKHLDMTVHAKLKNLIKKTAKEN